MLGAYLGSKIAVPLSSQLLKALFGGFLMFSAVLLWLKTRPASTAPAATAGKEGAA